MNLQLQDSDEFDLINTCFKNKAKQRQDVLIGIGDDAAFMNASSPFLAMAVDTLVEGVHFLPNANPADIGYKSLAVNLSDLAAVGAEPAWMLLALTMPTPDKIWTEKFSAGLFELAEQFNVQLIGGDTTRGPLTVTVQVTGYLPSAEVAIARRGAKVGDKIYVSGTLGDAGLGLAVAKGNGEFLSSEDKQYVLQRLHRPTPRVNVGMALRGIASSAIDISDGLLVDIGHLLAANQVGARIDADKLPLSSALNDSLVENEAKKLALTAGDDYELCFTVPANKESLMLARLEEKKVASYCIGEIIAKTGIEITHFSGELSSQGFKHW